MIVNGYSINVWPWSYFGSGNAELLVLSGECSKTRIEALTDIRAFDAFNFSFMK